MLFDLDTWRTITLGIVALGQTAFVLLYATFPWWRSFLGRALFFKAFTLAVLVDAFMVTRIVSWGHYDVLFVVLYGFFAIGVWFQFSAFLRVRLQHRQDQVSGNEVSDGE